MEEKVIEKKQDQEIVMKKTYTPPALTVYGKLTDLTGGGVGTVTEAAAMNNSSMNQMA